MGQEKMTENKVHVFENNKVSSKYSHICDIKSTSLMVLIHQRMSILKLTARESVREEQLK